MAKHHFIPVFYLGGFTDPVTPSGQTPFLWVGDVHTGKITRRAPRSVSRASGYYDWITLSDVPSAEQILGVFESRAAPIFRRLRLGDFSINVEDKYHVANLLGLQIVRLPHFVDIVTASLRTHSEQQLQGLVADDDALQALLRSYVEHHPSGSGLTADQVRESIRSGRILVRPNKDKSLSSALVLAFEFASLLFAMRWTIVISEDTSFFTTDQPLNLLTPGRGKPRFDFEHGENPDLEAFIAISPGYALLLHQKSLPRGAILRVDRAKSLELQWLAQLPTLKRYVYASSQAIAAWAVEQHQLCAPTWNLANWPPRDLSAREVPNP